MKIEWWQKWAAVTIVLAGGLAALYLFRRYALSYLLPFLLAFLFAVLTRPLVVRLTARAGGHEKAVAFCVTGFFLCATVCGCYLFSLILFSQLQSFTAFLAADAADENGMFAAARAFFGRVTAWAADAFPGLRQVFGGVDRFFEGFLQQLVSSCSGAASRGAARFFTRLPGFAFSCVVCIVAAFFIAADYTNVTRTLCGLLPLSIRKKLPSWRAELGACISRYLRAYALLFLLTFGELFCGFLLLREKYAFLLAVAIAALDILPVLGVGSVLIPWAVIRIICGRGGAGVALLLLWGVITVVRQIAEPRLVGKSLGIHPLLMLFSFYAGMKIFGVAGIFIGPLLAVFLKFILKKKTGSPTT